MEALLRDIELSIICPVVNCLDYTKEFIKTIKTKREYRLIIIDNGSTDGTQAYFSSLKNNENIYYIRNDDNMGVAPAWNEGIELGIKFFNSKYFFIPNNDILLKKTTIDKLIDDLQRKNVLLSTAFNVNTGYNFAYDLENEKIPEIEELTEAPDFSCFMIKKETIDKIGMFDEKFWPAYFEDNDYHFRIKIAGFKAIKNNQNLYWHYGSMTIKKNDETRRLSNQNYLNNKAYFIKKWGGCPGNEVFKTPFGE